MFTVRSRRGALLGVASIAAAALLGACTTASNGASTSGPIKVGLITPLTGAFAALGKGDEQGAQIAVSQINQSGGIDGRKIQLVTEDDKTDPAQSVVDFTALEGQGVVAVLGSSVSDSARAVAPKANQAKVPYLSLSPVDQTADPVEPYVFLIPATTPAYTTKMMQWFKAEGITSIAVGYDNTDIYTTNGYHSTVSAAPGYGVHIVDTEQFQGSTTDFSATVQHVGASGAQAFLVWATGPAPVILSKTFAGAGLASKTKLVMTPSDATTLYTQPAGSAAEGVVMSAAPAVIASELPTSSLKTEIDKLATPYQAKYGTQPPEFAADAYSGAELLFAALQKAGKNASRTEVQAALNDISVLTPDGQYDYSSSNHSGLTSADVVIVTVDNGQFTATDWEKQQYGTLPG